MRKSFVALALLVGAATMLTTLAVAQDSRDRDEGVKLMNARMAQQQLLTKAARLGTSADTDTMFIGHTTLALKSEPYHVGVGPYRPGVGGNYDGMWDFDTYDGGTIDSMQGWVQQVNPNTRSSGTIDDRLRPWQCLDWGNRMNAGPVQGRTPGIVSAWHADDGVYALRAGQSSSNSWSPLAGSKSAWCGLRAGDDFTVTDSTDLGGTGNHINGETVIGRYGDGVYTTNKNFPGYSNQWDQMLYRDVRVATGGALTVSFLYETQMDHRLDNAAASCKGWFDRDPLSMQQGGGGAGASNFISSSAYLGATAREGPIDSFMVYVGVPTDPAACQYSDGNAPRPVFDLKRRWFSEVIAIDKPYKEILSTFGHDSLYRSTPFEAILSNVDIQPMLDAQGATDGGGVIRVVFRSKTNANYSDETNTGGSFNSTNKGAVRIDEVAITGLATSGFETAREINNTIELPESSLPGPAVGEGYALRSWKATGKPPKLMAHTHPLFGGDIGPGNYYNPLVYEDMCGAADSPIRQCNINNVIISSTDHDLGEAAGGPIGTPFKENRNGFISPTINLVTPLTGPNESGIDRVHVETNDDWWIFYDMYSGMTSSTYGNVWGNSILSYPTTQKNGAVVWGDVGYFTGVWTNGDKQCFLMSDVLKPNIFTSNPSGIPDSCKLFIFREQRCITWGVTTNCSVTDGHYTDNVALVLPPPLAGVSDKISIDIWDWYNDAFPANEEVLPGSAAFDTCGAYIQTARNQSPNTGDKLRFDVPGDSIYVKAQNATGTPLRLDVVFRVFPGPGNYVIPGNKASGVRAVTAVPAAAVPGDKSFWSEYMTDPGQFAKPQGALAHPGFLWNVNAWNSVRCDTVETNIFPADGRAPNLPGVQPDFWMSTIYDAALANGDAQDEVDRYENLGISKNRCFLVNPGSGFPIDHTNITCSYVPTWVTDDPTTAGYDGNQTTKEYTKVFPDGLLTAGSHIQYFFRMAHLEALGDFVMTPDTNRISPQPTGSAWNYDGMRWEGISILPDRWKDAAYGGYGSACMLVVDYNDRRGDERGWVGLADTIGATVAAKYGAHNGWHATAAYIAPSDGSHNYSGETDCGTNPNIAVYTHGGQPGTTWDLYNVKAAESSTTGSAQIGGRTIPRTGMGLLAGKQSMQAPTPDMLRAYYKMLFIMSGDLNNRFFGALINRGQKDVEVVTDFLTYAANELSPRGLWAQGNGFVEGNTGLDAVNTTFLTTNLGVSLADPSYYALSGSTVLYPDLIASTAVSSHNDVYAVQNSCTFTNDVLDFNTSVPGAAAATHYQNLGTAGPYVSGVYVPSSTLHPYVTLVDGFDMLNMFSRYGGNTVGRMDYFMNVLVNVFGSVCPFIPAPTIDVPVNTAKNVNINFVGPVGNNPMRAGVAQVSFSLAKDDLVDVKVFDVTGRLVKTLANRQLFKAGPSTLAWDGRNDQGQAVSRGVYFTQVKYINSRFVDAKKVTVLK
jgi:hypothetical protein